MRKSLFVNYKLVIDYFRNMYKVEVSEAFVRVADIQLVSFFEKKTNILVDSRRISFSFPDINDFVFQSGQISQISLNLYVNNNWNYSPIQWTSLSGKVYKPDDMLIDEKDIIFSFVDLNIPLIYKQMYPGNKYPFQVKKRSFELVVDRIDKDCIIEMELKPDHNNLEEIQHLADKMNGFFTRFNMASEKADRRDGVLYTWRHEINEWGISWQIDLGSVDYSFLNKMLDFVSKIGVVEKIRFI